jgi:hypothetical protein
MNRWITVFALTLAVLCAVPGMADKDKDKDRGKGKNHADRDRDRDDDRWERRGGYEYRTYDRNTRPPGWSKGKKTGWGDCDLPPGQAKKNGCRSYMYNGRTHYYYRDDQGRIIVRRPYADRDDRR